jgi:pre-rRNA-processing protein TSR4
MVVQLGFSVDIEDDDHRMLVGHRSPHYQEWDGGQMGGRPTWLNPKDIPKRFVQCLNCDTPMMFICQLYAPCEDINPNAYHRSLYVFACSNSSACAHQTTGSVRVLRAQLPEDNPYFPAMTATSTQDRQPHQQQQEAAPDHRQQEQLQYLPHFWNNPLCQVCGQRGGGKCPLQQEYFCGPHHQREYKKYIYDNQKQNQSLQPQQISSSSWMSMSMSSLFLPSVLTESELVVEDEPTEAVVFCKTPQQLGAKSVFDCNKNDGNNVEDDDDNDDDQNLEQQDLNEMIGAADESVSKDNVTMSFYDRLNKVTNIKTQCLRYLRWPDPSTCVETSTPLWIRSDYQPDTSSTVIPPICDRCGSERRFEFQLMPQMLHYLFRDLEQERKRTIEHHPQRIKIKEEDIEALTMATSIMDQAPPEQVPPDLAANKEAAIDTFRNKLMEEDNKTPSWGVVSIYTCTSSCGGMDGDEDAEFGAYAEEFAWKQPSLD